jgi:hypothetical protein
MISTHRPRVIWTVTEQESVFKAAAELGPPEPGDSPTVFKLMQEHLPPERRRQFDPALMARINAHRRGHGLPQPKAKAKPTRDELAELAALTKDWDDVPVPAADVAELPQPTLTAVPMLSELTDKASSVLTEVVLGVLYAPDIRAAVRDLIKEVLAPEVQAKVEQGVLWRDKLPGQESRKRVVIASGGKAALAFEHLKPLQRFYDIRTWNSSEANPARLRAILASADAAVVHASSISHSGSNTVRDWARTNKDRKMISFNRNIAQLAEELPGLLGDSLKLESVA